MLDAHVQIWWVPTGSCPRIEKLPAAKKLLDSQDVSMQEVNIVFSAKYEPTKELLWHKLQIALIKSECVTIHSILVILLMELHSCRFDRRQFNISICPNTTPMCQSCSWPEAFGPGGKVYGKFLYSFDSHIGSFVRKQDKLNKKMEIFSYIQ